MTIPCRLELDSKRWLELWRETLKSWRDVPRFEDDSLTFGFPKDRLLELLLKSAPAHCEGEAIPACPAPEEKRLDFFGVSIEPKEGEPPPPYEALSLIARINLVKWVEPGTGLSYGHTFTAERRMRVATITIGYGDGYCRYFSNKGRFIVRGVACPVVGRVCMDQSLIDVTDHPELSQIDVETEAIAAGHALLPWSDVLKTSGLHPAEMLAGIGKRVERVIR